MPAQSSRSIGFLMLVGSSLTLCGLICNNNAMLSPSLLRYDPSKSIFRLLVTIVPLVLFAFLQTNPLKSRQSLSCLCGTAEAPTLPWGCLRPPQPLTKPYVDAFKSTFFVYPH